MQLRGNIFPPLPPPPPRRHSIIHYLLGSAESGTERSFVPAHTHPSPELQQLPFFLQPRMASWAVWVRVYGVWAVLRSVHKVALAGQCVPRLPGCPSLQRKEDLGCGAAPRGWLHCCARVREVGRAVVGGARSSCRAFVTGRKHRPHVSRREHL